MPADMVSIGLVCADVLVRPVDALPALGTLGLVDTLDMQVGGLAGVTAAVFAHLGGQAAFIGRVGDDAFGRQSLQVLEQAGVDTQYTKRDPAHGTPATVVLVRSDGERTFLHHLGAAAALAPEDLDEQLIYGARAVHWGGPGVTPKLDGDPMTRLFKEARARGVITSFDTCFDGEGIWLPRIATVLPHTDIVFSSREEALHITGEEEPEAMARFFQNRGVGTVVIKLGAEGLHAYAGEQAVRFPAHAVSAVDTTGAGDAACAGFLHGRLAGWDLERCARYANAVGALSVQVAGAVNAISAPEQVEIQMEGAV
ncbi:MAG: carbohydrate kinase family protein [Candidatus Hydrogenedentota bacterium]